MRAIDYRFGDQTVPTEVVGGFWFLQRLSAPDRALATPISVTVTYDDGEQQRFRLTPTHTCGQVNHGC